MGLLDKLFGGGKKAENIKAALEKGALIVDVRTAAEFSGGSVPGALNYPVQTLSVNISKIKKTGKPVLAFCASGMRSAAATAQLKASGIEAYNVGTIGGLMKYMD